MNDIEFIQNVNKDDLIAYNYFIAKFNKRLTVNMKLIGLICIGFGIYTLVVDISQWYYSLILFLLGIFSVFFILPFYYVLIKLKIRKRKDEIAPIKVSFGEAGLLYAFEKSETPIDENEQTSPETVKDEVSEDKKIEIIAWDRVTKAIRENEYLYIFIDNNVILLIKYASCNEQKNLEDLLISRLGLNEKYFNQKNHLFFKKKENK